MLPPEVEGLSNPLQQSGGARAGRVGRGSVEAHPVPGESHSSWWPHCSWTKTNSATRALASSSRPSFSSRAAAWPSRSVGGCPIAGPGGHSPGGSHDIEVVASAFEQECRLAVGGKGSAGSPEVCRPVTGPAVGGGGFGADRCGVGSVGNQVERRLVVGRDEVGDFGTVVGELEPAIGWRLPGGGSSSPAGSGCRRRPIGAGSG